MTKNIYAKLTLVQNAVYVPKTEYNDYSNCYYRSVETIMCALKPKLLEQGLTLFINDDMVVVGTENYVKSTITLVDCETGEKIETTAYAKECLHGKMTADQSTISASSYARKAALNGMFLFDNDKESSQNQNQKTTGSQYNSNRTSAQANKPSYDKQGIVAESGATKPVSSWKNSPSSYAKKPTGNWKSKNTSPVADEDIPLPTEPPNYHRTTA